MRWPVAGSLLYFLIYYTYMAEKDKLKKFRELKWRHQSRIDFAARAIAEDVKKGKKIWASEWMNGPLIGFYNTRNKGRHKRDSELFDLAWKEVIEKASELSGIKIRPILTGERKKIHLKKELPNMGKMMARNSPSYKHAGEKLSEVDALERALSKIPEAKKTTDGRRYKLMGAAAGLKPGTVENYMQTQVKKIRGKGR